ncbi:MAG TPA: hypothetical protein VGI92_04390 [Gemmatimonadales bacterium]|jgi:hypothetical protein
MMKLAVIGASCLGGLSLVTALARRIAGPRSGPAMVLGAMASRGTAQDVETLREEVEQMRAEIAQLRERSAELDDVHNRLDFAERLLAQVREKPALPGPR